MAASHFKGYWSFRQNELPPQIKRESGGSLKQTILKNMHFWLLRASETLKIGLLGKK